MPIRHLFSVKTTWRAESILPILLLPFARLATACPDGWMDNNIPQISNKVRISACFRETRETAAVNYTFENLTGDSLQVRFRKEYVTGCGTTFYRDATGDFSSITIGPHQQKSGRWGDGDPSLWDGFDQSTCNNYPVIRNFGVSYMRTEVLHSSSSGNRSESAQVPQSNLASTIAQPINQKGTARIGQGAKDAANSPQPKNNASNSTSNSASTNQPNQDRRSAYYPPPPPVTATPTVTTEDVQAVTALIDMTRGVSITPRFGFIAEFTGPDFFTVSSDKFRPSSTMYGINIGQIDDMTKGSFETFRFGGGIRTILYGDSGNGFGFDMLYEHNSDKFKRDSLLSYQWHATIYAHRQVDWISLPLYFSFAHPAHTQFEIFVIDLGVKFAIPLGGSIEYKRYPTPLPEGSSLNIKNSPVKSFSETRDLSTSDINTLISPFIRLHMTVPSFVSKSAACFGFYGQIFYQLEPINAQCHGGILTGGAGTELLF